MPALLRIRDVEVDGRRGMEVLVRDGTISAVRPAAQGAPEGGERLVEGRGGALLPGLHDHHVHLFALAARATSVWVGPPEVDGPESLASTLRDHDRAVRGRDWMRGVGWDDHTAGWLDRRALDLAVPDRPVRVQHRSGALWVVNSAGLARLELDRGPDLPEGVERAGDGRPTGRLFGMDHWLATRIGTGPPDLTEVSRDLARCGVTGVTDATAHNGPVELAALAEARRAGHLRQRLVAMTRPGVDGEGPVKLVLAERALPALADLVATITDAHDKGRAVAVHAASREAVVLCVAALAEARARPVDRIEHASVVDPVTLDRLARLGATVVTQHHFLAESGDRYLADVPADDQRWLYRGRGFLDAGVPLAAGSDAPVGRPDPWAAMDAAVRRRAPSGRAIADRGAHARRGPGPAPGPARPAGPRAPTHPARRAW